MTTIAGLPEAGFVRLHTILRVFPISRSAWWNGVKNFRYPSSVKLGPRTTAWKVEDIRALIEKSGDSGRANDATAAQPQAKTQPQQKTRGRA